MKVNDDRSLDFNLGLEVDLSAMKDMMGEDAEASEEEINESSGFSEEDLKDLESKGYTVTTSNENGKYTMTISKNFKSIDDVATTDEANINLTEFNSVDKEVFFTVKKGFLSNTYIGHYTFDLSSSENSDMEGMSNYSQYLNLEYVLTLPHEAKSSNATTKSADDKTLTWDLEIGKVNEINFEFTLANSMTSYLMIGGIALLVLIVIVVIIFIMRNKNNQKPQQEAINNESNINPNPVNNLENPAVNNSVTSNDNPNIENL